MKIADKHGGRVFPPGKRTAGIIRAYAAAVLNSYGRKPVAFVRGRGAWIWDADGRRYLDFFPGVGTGALGHCHPAVVGAIRAQAGRLIHIANTYFNPWQARLASGLLRAAGFRGKVFFCNSGAEANEAAVKLARRWFQGVLGQKRHEVVTVRDSFHGRTLAMLAATGTASYGRNFAPLPSGFRHVPLNDVRAAARAIGGRTCAVMIEPILGEGGVQVPGPSYLRALRSLTRRRGALLIFDEVQTGCGRTGTFFAFRQTGVVPDAVTLAKPLAGGLPIGAMIAAERYAKALPPGTHASTFGGGPLVCAAGVAALGFAAAPSTLARVRAMGHLLRAGLEKLCRRHPGLVREVRGKGLMLGFVLSRQGDGVVDRCRRMGLLVNCTHRTVIRMLPPVVVGPREIAFALAVLDRALASEGAGPGGV